MSLIKTLFIFFFCLAFFIPQKILSQELKLPGRTQGTGTYFEIKDSQYLNVTLSSTEEIKVILESVPKMISLSLEPSLTASSTRLTLSGLESNKTYYKFKDSYQNWVSFETIDGTYTWDIDLTQSHHIWFQEEKSTVILPQDCENYGSWDSEKRACILEKDINDNLEIGEDNFLLDCRTHEIKGKGENYGIYFGKKSGVTIQNCKISNFYNGIEMSEGGRNTLKEILFLIIEIAE